MATNPLPDVAFFVTVTIEPILKKPLESEAQQIIFERMKVTCKQAAGVVRDRTEEAMGMSWQDARSAEGFKAHMREAGY